MTLALGAIGADKAADLDQNQSSRRAKPLHSPSELERRRVIREFVTTKLSEAEAFLDQRKFTTMSLARVMSGPTEWERKWIDDTYYGLRDRDLTLADMFGHPEWDSASVADRAGRLREMLDLNLL